MLIALSPMLGSAFGVWRLAFGVWRLAFGNEFGGLSEKRKLLLIWVCSNQFNIVASLM
jgi:hypothetical protein